MQAPFKFDLPSDTLAFVIISTPSMFEKAFIPYVKSISCSTERDPLDQCLIHYFDLVKQVNIIIFVHHILNKVLTKVCDG